MLRMVVTNKVREFSSKCTDVLSPLILEYMNQGMSIDDICFIINSVAHLQVSKNNVEKRLGKKIKD